MAELIDVILWIHVATGFVGLVAFWFPVFARKGGPTHVRFGRIYAYCAYVVTLSAVTAAIGRIATYRSEGAGIADRPDLYGFAVLLGYLGVTTFVIVRHGLRVIATRKAPETLRTPVDQALAWASMGGGVLAVAVAFAAWSGVSPILLGLSPIGIVAGWRILRAARRPAEEPRGWLYSHLGSMLGGGIAFHTAFTVFGAQRIFGYEIEGSFSVVPWILPTIVGIPAIVLWTRYYRRKFDPADPAAAS